MVGLGLGLGGPAGVPAWLRGWWAQDALIDADFAAGRFFYRGALQNGEAAFLSAASGVRDSTARILGPYVAPDAPEILTNGTFGNGVTGWAGQLGATLSVAGGELLVAGNGGNSACVSQAIAVEPGRAYRLRGRSRRVSSASSATIAISGVAGLSGSQNYGEGLSNTTTSYLDVVREFSALGTGMYVGARIIANPANGTIAIDDFSVKEAVPCAGFVAGGFSGVVAARTPAVASGVKILWQADDNSAANAGALERNFIRLLWDAERHLRLVVSYQTTANVVVEQANLDLGIIAVSTRFEMAFSVAAHAFRAALTGGMIQTDTAGLMPGLAVMRIGKGRTGGDWDGAIERLTLYPTARSAAEFEQLSAGNAFVIAWGDSLTEGTGASGEALKYPQAAQLLFSPARVVINRGVGGQTSTEIAARQGGLPVHLSVTGNTVPTSGAVAVTARDVAGIGGTGPITAQGVQSLTGVLGGVRGRLSRNGDGSHGFARLADGAAVAVPAGSAFLPDEAGVFARCIAWLWVGRNGAASGRTVEADIAAMVSRLGHERYLVGSILTATNDDAAGLATIQARNGVLAAAYGGRFVDLYGLLRAAGNGSVGDNADIAAGYIPRSLRFDAVHLNGAGYALVAAAMRDATLAHGW